MLEIIREEGHWAGKPRSPSCYGYVALNLVHYISCDAPSTLESSLDQL